MAVLASVAAAFLLPAFSQVQAGPRGGQVLRGTFPGELRPGLVYLPPGFTSTRRYPVMYLLHGMPGSPDEYLAGTGFLDAADEGIADGALSPFVAVMPAAGPRDAYDGEWAGPWETSLVDEIVPWVDAHLPTEAGPAGRTIGGLSAGGYGAVDIALRHPDLFGRVASWSGYFEPLRDGPFRHAPPALLAASDPVLLAPKVAPVLRSHGTRFFLSTGPAHSHWFTPAQTLAFARELHRLGVPVVLRRYAQERGVWRAQMTAALGWAFGVTASA